MTDNTALLAEIAALLAKGEPVVLATVVRTSGSTPRKAGARMIVRRDGSCSGTICGGCVEAEVYARARELFGRTRPELLSFTLNDAEAAEYGLRCGGTMEVFVEQLTPRRQVWIVGAGHIGQALAALCRSIDMDVHILDDHAGFLTAERFPGCSLHACALEETGSTVPEGPHIAAVIATRGHKQDSTALRGLIRKPLGYLGLVASQKRVMEFYTAYLRDGLTLDQLRRVAAPVGLDIAAETPEEIALSIAAEILAAFRGAGKKSLSELFWSTPAAEKLPRLAELKS